MLSRHTTQIMPVTVTIFVLCILIFSLYIAVKYRPEQYKKTRLKVFFSSLASVAIILVGINIILASIAFEYDQHFSRISQTKEAVDKLWLYPNRLLVNSHHIRPEFLASFFMNNLELYNLILLPNKKSVATKESITEEQFIANVMIQAWEDFLTMREYDIAPMDVWLRTYLTWAQNPYFKSYYDIMKFQYNNTTIQLGDLLFEYAAKIPVPTKDLNVYQTAIEELMNDRRYINLMRAI